MNGRAVNITDKHRAALTEIFGALSEKVVVDVERFASWHFGEDERAEAIQVKVEGRQIRIENLQKSAKALDKALNVLNDTDIKYIDTVLLSKKGVCLSSRFMDDLKAAVKAINELSTWSVESFPKRGRGRKERRNEKWTIHVLASIYYTRTRKTPAYSRNTPFYNFVGIFFEIIGLEKKDWYDITKAAVEEWKEHGPFIVAG